jgi:hypothetical protein
MADIRTEYGRRLANNDAIEQAVKMNRCLDENACMDSGSTGVASNETVSAIIIVDGDNDPVTVTFPAAIVATDEDGINAAIVDALKSGIPDKEYNIWSKYVYDADNSVAIFAHIGVFAVTTLVISGGNLTTSRVCTTITQCRYTANVDDGSTPTVNGTTVGGGPYAINSDEEDLETAIETRLTAESINWQDVQVVNDGTVFVVHIYAEDGSDIQINDEDVDKQECKQAFA